MALTVLSVRQGDKYGPEYTQTLKRQVPTIVLGDDLPLHSRFTGWHAKFELFAPWNSDLRPCLFLDLDTYVIGDLSPFHELDPTVFWMIDDFNRPKRAESGVMVIPKNINVWDYCENADLRKGDGDFLRNFPHQRLNSEISGIYSYKNSCRDQCPDDARLVCFHGQPKPHNCKGWAKHYWDSLQ